MQLADLAARIAPLPEPPLLERWVTESPLVPAIALAIAGIVALVITNARGSLRNGLIAAGVQALLALGVVVSASLIETERERLQSRTRALVASVAEGDRAAFFDAVREDTTITIPRGASMSAGSAWNALPTGLITAWSLPEIQAVADGPNSARTQVRVRHSGSDAIPPASWWKIDWYRAGPEEPWRAAAIEPLWVAGWGNL